MTTSHHLQMRETLTVGAALVLVVVALPLLAVLSLVGRAVFFAAALAAVVAGILLFALSPRFRAWLRAETEGEMTLSGLRLATDVAVHPGHSWARVEPDQVWVGADDLVAAVLGPPTAVETPAVGSRVRRGEPLVELRRGERRVTLPAPVSGTVLGRNGELDRRPWLLREEPYAGGWLLRLRSDAPRAQRRKLLSGGAARAWFRKEVDRLLTVLTPGGTLAPALPDGGTLVGELYRQIDDPTWERLSATLFTPSPDEKPRP